MPTEPVPTEPVRAEEKPAASCDQGDLLRRHIERHVGQIEQVVSVDADTDFPLDLLWVPPSPTRQFHTLVTSGMSRLPMHAPNPQWQYAELCVLLLPHWPLNPQSWASGGGDWPVQWLKRLARLPQATDSWLGFGHTIANDEGPNGGGPAPFSPETELSSWLLLPPVSLPQRFSRLLLPDRRVLNFWCLVALHPDELALKMRKNTHHLLTQFGRRGVQDILDPKRRSVLEAPPTSRWSRLVGRPPEEQPD